MFYRDIYLYKRGSRDKKWLGFRGLWLYTECVPPWSNVIQAAGDWSDPIDQPAALLIGQCQQHKQKPGQSRHGPSEPGPVHRSATDSQYK